MIIINLFLQSGPREPAGKNYADHTEPHWHRPTAGDQNIPTINDPNGMQYRYDRKHYPRHLTICIVVHIQSITFLFLPHQTQLLK